MLLLILNGAWSLSQMSSWSQVLTEANVLSTTKVVYLLFTMLLQEVYFKT